jgi:hypothetical protein
MEHLCLSDGNGTILLIGLLDAVLISLYGFYRCKNKHSFTDPLQANLGPEFLSNWTDGWSLSHFLFYFALGWAFPQRHNLWFIFAMGCAWEAIEASVPDKPFYMYWSNECSARDVLTTDTRGESEKRWWYGKWEDIVVNTVGMLAGAYVRTYMK